MMNTLLEQTMNTQRNIASFMLRFTQDLWQDENGEPKVQWRGNIHHVQGEEEATFTDLAEALAFIQKQLTELTLNAIPQGVKMEQEKVLKESFKLWEQFASSYSNMMFDAMERTIQQSQAIKDQMDEAVKQAMQGWQMPAASPTDDPSEIVELLKSLQKQIADLTKKVEKLEKTVAQQSNK